MKTWKLAATLACIAMPAATAFAAQAVASAAPSVAVQQASVSDPGHGSITVAIWYPANPASGGTSSPAIVGTHLPLVVISHGTGAGPISHIDTAQALAAAGFVVVAPMHPGDNFQDDKDVGKPQWLVNRSRHVSRVIDFMLTEWAGHDRLNPHAIGIFGFSAGATTALIAIGGTPDLGRVAPHCAQQREFVCGIMAPPSAAEAAKPVWTHDGRIAAAVVAAPGLGFTFEPSGLTQVRVPVQLWAGSEDRTVPYETNTAIVRRLLPQPPEFHKVDGAVHLSFLAPCDPQTPPALCQDRPGFDRQAFHRDFDRAVVDFFRKHLPTK